LPFSTLSREEDLLKKTAAVLIIPLLPLALVGALFTLRRPPTRRVGIAGIVDATPAVGDPRFLRLVEHYTPATFRGGHDVEILRNGDGTYPRMWQDLCGAARSITVHTYFWESGTVADRLAAVLGDRARAGVRVLLLYDSVGSSLPRSYFRALEASGVRVAELRGARPQLFHQTQHRSHVRAMVIDGRIGYTGGFGFADKWLGGGRSPGEWRETNVRLMGSAVGELQGVFGALWTEATGTLLTEREFFPEDPPESSGGALAGLVSGQPTIGSTVVMRFLALSFSAARHRLYITSAYFVPTDAMVALLEERARLGVDVRILTASGRSDAPPAWLAGRARYETLLRAGVRVWEYQPAMMHAKTFIVDGEWCTVGAINIDNRSAALMDEATLAVLSRPLASELEAHFLEDLARSREMTLETFGRRPIHDRIAEQGSSLLSRLL